MNPRKKRSQSESAGDKDRQLPTSFPFAIPQPSDPQLPLLNNGPHDQALPTPLNSDNDFYRAMASTFEMHHSQDQSHRTSSTSPIDYSLRHPYLPLPQQQPQIDPGTLALLQLLAQSQAYQQPLASTSFMAGAPGLGADRRETPSGSDTTGQTGQSAEDDGDADDYDDRGEQPEGDGTVITEDKRRRNTAASARFRNKKKQWVLNMERNVTSLSRQVDELEREASDLRRENGWLKEIVMLKTSKFSGSQGATIEPKDKDNSESSQGGGSSSKGKGKQKRSQ